MKGKDALVDRAIYWQEQNIPVVPVRYMDKAPLVKWKRWVGKEQPKQLVINWFTNKYPCNLGVILSSGLCVVDFDDPFSYLSWSERVPHLAKSYTARTGRGLHVYLWLAREERFTYHFDGGELKCNGIVVAPPSIHKSGRAYSDKSEFSRILGVAGIDDIGVRIMDSEVDPTSIERKGYKRKSDGDTIGKIKDVFPIARFLAEYIEGGYRSLGDGTFITKCPFHDDNNPSLRVYPEEGFCFCYSPSCVAHRSTDVVKAASLLWNVSNTEAVHVMAQMI